MKYETRTYGTLPYEVVLVHGGPGAPGTLTPLAHELKTFVHVLEPFFVQDSLEGQLAHLKATLDQYAEQPVTLLGHSWGAWLTFLFAARHGSMVRKLILVGAGPFDASYASTILPTRLSRLPERSRQTVLRLTRQGDRPLTPAQFRILGQLLAEADCYDCLPFENPEGEYLPEVHARVWAEGVRLRQTGRLLEAGNAITCPVVAIHGDHDPHPAEGVESPLSKILPAFRFHLLTACGHYPWYERQAKSAFLALLKKELKHVSSP